MLVVVVKQQHRKFSAIKYLLLHILKPALRATCSVVLSTEQVPKVLLDSSLLDSSLLAIALSKNKKYDTDTAVQIANDYGQK